METHTNTHARRLKTVCAFFPYRHPQPYGKDGPLPALQPLQRPSQITHTHTRTTAEWDTLWAAEEQREAISAFNKIFWEIYSNCLFTVMVCLDKHKRSSLTFDVF